MLPKIRFGESTGPLPERDRGNDRLRRVVHAALAVYLLPAFLVVFAVGGVLIAILGVARAVTWVASKSLPPAPGQVKPPANRGAYRGPNSAPDVPRRRLPVATTLSQTGWRKRSETDLEN